MNLVSMNLNSVVVAGDGALPCLHRHIVLVIVLDLIWVLLKSELFLIIEPVVFGKGHVIVIELEFSRVAPRFCSSPPIFTVSQHLDVLFHLELLLDLQFVCHHLLFGLEEQDLLVQVHLLAGSLAGEAVLVAHV